MRKIPSFPVIAQFGIAMLSVGVIIVSATMLRFLFGLGFAVIIAGAATTEFILGAVLCMLSLIVDQHHTKIKYGSIHLIRILCVCVALAAGIVGIIWMGHIFAPDTTTFFLWNGIIAVMSISIVLYKIFFFQTRK